MIGSSDPTRCAIAEDTPDRANQRGQSDGRNIRGARKRALAPASSLTAKAIAIKGAVAALWPPAMIGFGFALMLAWSGALLWLFVQLILDVI